MLDMTSGLLAQFNLIGSNSFSGGHKRFDLELIRELNKLPHFHRIISKRQILWQIIVSFVNFQ